jgi:uncharacterized protein (TIGR03000 family)
MYSIVLATMLTTSTASPAWGGHQGGPGCGLFHGAYAGCHGCNGSCYGACYGNCHGCYGSAFHVIPVGTYPAYSYGCSGVFGSCTGCYGSCTGCWGGGGYSYANYNGGVWGANYFNMQPASPPVEVKPETKKKTDAKTTGSTIGIAKITIELPEDAKLTVDGVACPLTTSKRILETPQLQAGQQYFYTLEATVVRNGETIVESQRVIFECDKNVRVDFRKLGAVQATKR